MAENEISRAGLNQIIRRTLNIKGDLPPSPVVGAEIIPTLNLENDRPEWLFLSGERRLVGEINIDPPAGQRVNCGLTNPSGSGVMAVIESITIQSTTHIPFATVRFGSVGGFTETSFYGATPVLQGAICTDFRFHDQFTGSTQGSVTRFLLAQTVNGMAGFFLVDLVNPMNAPPADVIDRTGPIVLPPGWHFGCQFGLDVIICCCFRWRERPLEPAEEPLNMRRQ